MRRSYHIPTRRYESLRWQVPRYLGLIIMHPVIVSVSCYHPKYRDTASIWRNPSAYRLVRTRYDLQWSRALISHNCELWFHELFCKVFIGHHNRSHLKNRILFQGRGGDRYPKAAGFPVWSFSFVGQNPQEYLIFSSIENKSPTKVLG